MCPLSCNDDVFVTLRIEVVNKQTKLISIFCFDVHIILTITNDIFNALLATIVSASSLALQTSIHELQIGQKGGQ